MNKCNCNIVSSNCQVPGCPFVETKPMVIGALVPLSHYLPKMPEPISEARLREIIREVVREEIGKARADLPVVEDE